MCRRILPPATHFFKAHAPRCLYICNFNRYLYETKYVLGVFIHMLHICMYLYVLIQNKICKGIINTYVAYMYVFVHTVQ